MSLYTEQGTSAEQDIIIQGNIY